MAKSPDAFRTISEVADWLDIQAHVLRFWESKFTQVKPIKRAGGRRYYRPADMLLLGGIKKLLHDDGLTIKGVQKILREEGMSHVSSLSPPLDDVDAAALEASAQSYDEVAAAPMQEGAAEDESARSGVVLSFGSPAASPTSPETPEAVPAPEEVGAPEAASDPAPEDETAQQIADAPPEQAAMAPAPPVSDAVEDNDAPVTQQTVDETGVPLTNMTTPESAPPEPPRPAAEELIAESAAGDAPDAEADAGEDAATEEPTRADKAPTPRSAPYTRETLPAFLREPLADPEISETPKDNPPAEDAALADEADIEAPMAVDVEPEDEPDAPSADHFAARRFARDEAAAKARGDAAPVAEDPAPAAADSDKATLSGEPDATTQGEAEGEAVAPVVADEEDTGAGNVADSAVDESHEADTQLDAPQDEPAEAPAEVEAVDPIGETDASDAGAVEDAQEEAPAAADDTPDAAPAEASEAMPAEEPAATEAPKPRVLPPFDLSIEAPGEMPASVLTATARLRARGGVLGPEQRAEMAPLLDRLGALRDSMAQKRRAGGPAATKE